MLMFLQQYKEQIFNIVESVYMLLFFTIIVGQREFFHKNKVDTFIFISIYIFCGYWIDTYIPKGYSTLLYSLFLCILFHYLVKTKILQTLYALFLCFSIILSTEFFVAMFFSLFIFEKDVLSVRENLKSFIVVGIAISVLRLFIICFLYRYKISIRSFSFFKKLNLFFVAIIVQFVTLFIFFNFAIIGEKQKTPIMYEYFCYIILVTSLLMSFFLFRLKEKQLKLQYELEYKEKLAIANERNRISRELHDTLGHTLTLLITLIKSSRINIKKDPEVTEKKLVQAADIASEGLKQIRTTISGWLPEKLNSVQITSELSKLIEFAKDAGINIDFSVYGKERINAPGYSEVLYKICREAITNSLRHSKATKIIIILKFTQKDTQLFITDNGVGCKNIKKGFGLIGLEERVRDINGTLSYGTSGNKGFNIHARIPNEVISNH